jgi:hypothetical protein
MSHLIYINGLGPNYRGDNMYEFIFSGELGVWGENWDARPANGYPEPPELKYIKEVGQLSRTTIQLELIQNCDFMGVTDAMEDIIALAWEKDESCEDNTRLVFRFGDTLEKVKDKLYERDLILDFDKEVVYEK